MEFWNRIGLEPNDTSADVTWKIKLSNEENYQNALLQNINNEDKFLETISSYSFSEEIYKSGTY